MKGQWARWTVMAVAASFLAAAAQAGETKVRRAEARVEIRAEKPGEEPQVRIWVNGKEVEPGKAIDLGGKGRVQVQTGARSGRKTDDRREEARGGKDRGVLGVMIAPLDDATAERADVKAGAVVRGTTPGSAARKAGLREGDVITSVDGKRVESPRGLADYIADRRPGDRLRLEWSRGGRRMRETVVLGTGEEEQRRSAVQRKERPDEPPKELPPRKEPPPPKDAPKGAFLGVMAAPLTDEVREIAGTDEGVLINSLTDGSPAAKGGLQPGDVVVRIDDRQVHSPAELVDAVGRHKPGDRIPVVYYRMGKRREAQVALGRQPGEGELKKEAMPFFDLPNDFFGDMPQIRKYLEKLQPDIEQWTKRFREQQAKPHPPAPAPKIYPGIRPDPDLGKPQPGYPPYDVGKDMGRILERLERIERRLDEMEKRLQRRQR